MPRVIYCVGCGEPIEVSKKDATPLAICEHCEKERYDD